MAHRPTNFFTSIWRVNGFFTSSNRYSGRLRSYIGRICTPFAYLAGLYVLLAPSKSAIFVDLGPKMAKYGRWRPDTGVTHQLIAVLCSLVTMAAMYGHWLTHLRRIWYLRYPISAPVIRRFVWGNALRGGQSRGGASNGPPKTPFLASETP